MEEKIFHKGDLVTLLRCTADTVTRRSFRKKKMDVQALVGKVGMVIELHSTSGCRVAFRKETETVTCWVRPVDLHLVDNKERPTCDCGEPLEFIVYNLKEVTRQILAGGYIRKSGKVTRKEKDYYLLCPSCECSYKAILLPDDTVVRGEAFS